jgi:Zn-dependent M28 family amino/carboxypeptidase
MSDVQPFDLDQLQARLRRHVEILAQSPRWTTSRSHRNAQEYIADRLQLAGFSVQESNYLTEGMPCTNLIARLLPPPDKPLVVVGAHYDTVPGTPGADDNASAVAALLELARWIAPPLRAADVSARLELVAYDLEEYGMIGSTIHAGEIHRAGVPLRGMISLEMLGYTDLRPGSQNLPPHLAGLYPGVGNFIGVCGNQASQPLLDVIVAGMKSIAGLPVESIAVPGRGETLPPVRLSDHSSFWDRGFPAVMITDTSFLRNPHYHCPSDTPETLDYDFLAKVTVGICAAVWLLLR